MRRAHLRRIGRLFRPYTGKLSVVTLLILCGIAGRVRAPEALGRRD